MNTRTRITGAVAGAALAALALTGCGGNGTTVTGKHPCKQHGKPAYCLNLSTGRVVYVPRTVWVAARSGDGYSDEGGAVHVDAPPPAGRRGRPR